jgi:hypothetical protein
MIPVLIMFMVIGMGGAATYHEPEAKASPALSPKESVQMVDRENHNYGNESPHLIYSEDLESAPMEPEPESTIIPMPAPKNERQEPVDRLKSVEEIRRVYFYPSHHEVNTDQQENENESADQ